MNILNVYGEVIYASEKTTIKGAVEAALSKKVSLRGSNLRGSDLSYSDLRGSDLSNSNLSNSNLSNSNLRGSDLRGSDLRNSSLNYSNLSGSDLRGSDLRGSDLSNSDLRGSDLRGSNLSNSNLRGSDLRGSDLRGSNLNGITVASLRSFSGLYEYTVWSVLSEDGSRWVRMGCLFKSLDDWEKIGIRKSNTAEFPDDGSEKSEERALAFEFAKAAALRLE